MFGWLTGRSAPKARADAGKFGRILRSWVPSRTHINTIAAADGPLTLARARDLARDTALAASAVRGWAGAVAGCGIKPSPLVDDAAVKAEMLRLWRDWTDESDADGLTDFYGQQALAARELFLAGECFVRFRPRRMSDGLTVPLQLQFVPSEMLPVEKTESAANGNEIRCGVEFDTIGRRVAYHFLRRHPGDQTLNWRLQSPDMYTRVPAEEVVHMIVPQEAGQIRGLSALAPAVVRLRQLDEYMHAQIERQKVAALFAGFVIQADQEVLPNQEDQGDGTSVAPLQPATMQVLGPGEDVRFAEPPGPGADFEPFSYRATLDLSAALGVPYSTVTGDLRQASYGSQRAGMLDFRRTVEQVQHQVMVFQLCRPVWNRWLDAAVLSGALTLPSYEADPRPWRACKWITPRWDWIDPKKDLEAEALAVANGFKSRSDVVEASGYDVEETDKRIADDQDRERELGLVISPNATPAPNQPADPAAP